MIYHRPDGSVVQFTTLLEDASGASVFRHFKDKRYHVITMAKHSEDMALYVVYRSLYGAGEDYIRPAEMFFSKVSREEYPEADQEYRFELVET